LQLFIRHIPRFGFCETISGTPWLVGLPAGQFQADGISFFLFLILFCFPLDLLGYIHPPIRLLFLHPLIQLLTTTFIRTNILYTPACSEEIGFDELSHIFQRHFTIGKATQVSSFFMSKIIVRQLISVHPSIHSADYELYIRQGPERAKVAGVKEKGVWVIVFYIYYFLSNMFIVFFCLEITLPFPFENI
jgi:hypothetical protein